MFDTPPLPTLSQAHRLMSAHRTEEAIRLVDDLTARDPDNLDAWLFLAFYYMDFDYCRALDAWQHIARLRPDDQTAQEAIEALNSFVA